MNSKILAADLPFPVPTRPHRRDSCVLRVYLAPASTHAAFYANREALSARRWRGPQPFSFVSIHLLYQISDGCLRWFKLLGQIRWDPPVPGQLDHLIPEFLWVWRTCSWHGLISVGFGSEETSTNTGQVQARRIRTCYSRVHHQKPGIRFKPQAPVSDDVRRILDTARFDRYFTSCKGPSFEAMYI